MSSKYESKEWQQKVELDCRNGKAEHVKEKNVQRRRREESDTTTSENNKTLEPY